MHFCGIIITLSEEIIIVISYNRLWKLLIDRKMKRADLVSGAGISTWERMNLFRWKSLKKYVNILNATLKK